MILIKVISYSTFLQMNFIKLLATRVYENKKTEGEINYNDVANLVAEDKKFNFLKGWLVNIIIFTSFILVWILLIMFRKNYRRNYRYYCRKVKIKLILKEQCQNVYKNYHLNTAMLFFYISRKRSR